MIFRLAYCNKHGDTARIDITTPGGLDVMEVEGTGTPFNLQFKNDKPDKSGNFRTSSAEINIYETPEFNIDTLKTSNETDIKVDYYINDVKRWAGYVIPDFFSREIGGSGAVSMVASDRISTLKGVTLGELPEYTSIRELAVRCLANTGLDLPLKTMADFLAGQFGFNDFFRSKILSQRLIDTRGRSISCYDILGSILIASNSLLVQRDAELYIINKFQHETGIGNLYSTDNTSTKWESKVYNFNEVTKGAMRSIIPVAASVGIFHEHGGGRLHPENYDFSKGLNGWTAVNGFKMRIENKEVTGYDGVEPKYGEETKKNMLVNYDNASAGFTGENLDLKPYVKTTVPVIANSNSVDVTLDLSITSARIGVYYVILAEKGAIKRALNISGAFETYSPTNENFRHFITTYYQEAHDGAASKTIQIKGVLSDSDLTGYTITLRIYGAGKTGSIFATTFINFASLSFKSSQEIPKGNIYKREQGSNFTKIHEIETSIFGDHINIGFNGFFYDYPIDDTSSLFTENGELETTWFVDIPGYSSN